MHWLFWVLFCVLAILAFYLAYDIGRDQGFEDGQKKRRMR